MVTTYPSCISVYTRLPFYVVSNLVLNVKQTFEETMSKYNLPIYVVVALATVPLYLSSSVLAENSAIEEVEVLGENNQQGLRLSAPSSTASRIATPLKKLPASVSVISKEDMAMKGDYSALSATTRAAGISAAAAPGNGGSAMTARGFSGNNSVMTLYDGNRIFTASGTVSFPSDTWTIERIEVLRGANSVINGVGAIGATVNYITKKPKFAPIESEIAVSYGSDNIQRYAFGSGGQMDERSAYRIDVAHFRTDGYVKGNKQQRTAVSNSYLVKAHDDVDITFAIDYSERKDDRTYYGTPLVNGKLASGTRKNNYNADDAYIKFEDIWPRVNLTWRINEQIEWRSNVNYLHSDRRWVNIESYRYNNATQQVDLGDYLDIGHKQEQLGTRHDMLFNFDLSDTVSSTLNLGFEINKLNCTHHSNSPYAQTDASTNLYHPKPGKFYDHALSPTQRGMETETMQYALFLDHVFDFNQQWQLVTGIRRDQVDFERKNKAINQPDYNGRLYTTSWRAGVVYQPIESLSIYTQYSRSVEAMGALVTLSEANLSQDPMIGKQYEIGLKQDLFQEKLQYAISLFEIRKINLLSQDPNDPSPAGRIQIGEQRSRGIEAEVYWQALEQLSFDINAMYTDAKYREYKTATDNFNGKSPTGVPRKTANVWATWHIVEPVSFGLGVRYVGQRYLDFANTQSLPNYVVYDANLTWNVNQQLTLSLKGKNLDNNRHYILSGNNTRWLMADGRTFEASLHYSF